MPLTKYIRKKNNERKEERDKSGGGDIFFMKKVRDLSAKVCFIACRDQLVAGASV
jgi:hypothetical protein